MKSILILVIGTLFLNISYCQIEKRTWLVGGNGTLRQRTSQYLTGTEKVLNIMLSPNVGYCIIDKLVLGINMPIAYQSSSVLNYNTYFIGLGPFVRYYLLPKEKRINLLAQVSDNYNIYHSNTNTYKNTQVSNTFSFLSGPVFFINSNIGLESLIIWEHLKDATETTNTFGLRIGLQIHLIK